MPSNTRSSDTSLSIGGIIARFVTSAVVLGITAFFTPGFQISSIWTLALSSVVLTVIDYLVNLVLGVNVGPFGKGITGFVVAAIILYVTQFFVVGYSINWVSAIIGAIIYGIVASFIPGKQM